MLGVDDDEVEPREAERLDRRNGRDAEKGAKRAAPLRDSFPYINIGHAVLPARFLGHAVLPANFCVIPANLDPSVFPSHSLSWTPRFLQRAVPL